MDSAVGLLLFVMIFLSLLVLAAISQTQVQTLSYSGVQFIRNESMRAKENIKITLMSDRHLIITT